MREHHIGDIYDLELEHEDIGTVQIKLVHDELGYNDDTEMRPVFEVAFMDEHGNSFVWEDNDTLLEAQVLIERETRRLGIWPQVRCMMRIADLKRELEIAEKELERYE